MSAAIWELETAPCATCPSEFERSAIFPAESQCAICATEVELGIPAGGKR